MVPNRLVIYCMIFAVIIANAAFTTKAGSPAKPATLFKPTHPMKPLRILGVFPFNAFSHYQMFKAIMLTLVERGHHVTVFSPYKFKEPVANFVEIDLSKEFPPLRDTFHFTFASQNYGSENVFKMTEALASIGGAEMCRKTFNHPYMKDVIAGKHKFDILFTEIFATDCFIALGYKLKIPTISIATAYNLPWTADYTGDVENPAFFQSMYRQPSSDGLSTFRGRLDNTLLYIQTKIAYWWYMDRPSEAVIGEVFGADMPPLAQLRRNVSLVMGNCHDILVGPKPTVPRFLQVAGIHLREPDFTQVSKGIKDWLDGAPNGVLYFTLGSLVRSDSLPPRIFKALTTAFAKLKPLRILWKYESGTEHAKAAGVPDNVMVEKWLPQMEILAHPNVKGFMTHGGLMSSLEALYHGVPMVGLPIFGDQAANVAKFAQLGVAVMVDHAMMDEEIAYNSIKKIVSDPKIQEGAKELSARFQDRQNTPAETVVWWTEYIERHGGAPYLESPGSYMPIWQYLLLDVIGALIAVLIAAIIVLVYIIKLSIRLIKPSSPSAASSKKKN